MTMAEAPPPPLQMAAAPMRLSRRMRLCRRVHTMRAPEQPMGCPSASAPPVTSTFAGSSLSRRMLAIDTTENAWLISQRSTSPTDSPASPSALGRARAGDVGKSMGTCSASAKETMRASGVSDSSCARCADMMTRAHPPSLMEEEVAAVTVPSSGRKAGCSCGIFSTRSRDGSSSTDTTVSPALVLIETGTISLAKCPPETAANVRRIVSIVKASCSSRVILYCAAHFSAHMPMCWSL
mmetsp:Transcript_38220/g.80079  ORF Transcript_38220/g.80079 Transcript_38220/m.80079 type:complete len:238 (+) Transcript_38220:28-741(+)